MASTNEDIANSALSKLGASKISSLSDNTRSAILINEQFHKKRKELLRSHPWNFAIKRAFLTRVRDTSTSVNFSTDTFTSGSTLNMETGDQISITLNSGTLPSPLQSGQVYYAIKLTSTTFQLAETQDDAALGTAIDISNAPTFNASFFVGAPFEYGSKFSLPSDFLRALKEEEKDIDWVREGQLILSNDTSFNMEYIADISDPTLFDPSFDELLALMLARELAYPLVQSMTLKDQMDREFRDLLREVRSYDAQEGIPDTYETTSWTAARL